MKPRGMQCTILAILAFWPFHSLLSQTQFLPLGFLDGYGPTSEATAVTRDGSKLVGYSTTSLTENQACTWTWEGIAAIPGEQHWYANAAYGTSADGNVIVGDRGFGGTQEAWFWTPTDTFQLVPFSEPQRSSSALGVTGDGRIVVGTATSSGTLQSKPFRWDRAQPLAVFLPPYPSSTVPNAGATGISDDGRRVFGWVQTSLTTQAAARWDDGGDPILLSQPGDTIVAVTANSITPDGSVLVGSAVNTATGKGVGFKWTAAGGVVGLANPTTGYYAMDGATAIRVSGDGRVIVGYGENVAGVDEAILWVDEQPYRVFDVASTAGVLPDPWEPFRAYGVDYFGNTICGYGRATSGKLEAYVLIIDATPVPPPLVAPAILPVFAPGAGLAVRYNTVPGLRYRLHGGSDPQQLSPLGEWRPGLGMLEEFVADATVTGGSNRYFLRLEVAQP